MLNPSLDLSNPCNLNCPYCYIEEKNSDRKRRKPSELTLEETMTVLRDFFASGAKTVNLVGAGEPTIDPHFREVVEEISKNGLTTVLFTNGIALAKDVSLIEFLYTFDVTVVLKFNSREPQIQDLVAGRIGYTKTRDMALSQLLGAGFNAEYPTRLAFDIMAFHGNAEEIPAITDFCRDNNIFPISATYIPTGRTENGRYNGFISTKTLPVDIQSRVADLLQPLTLKQIADVKRRVAQVDNKHGLKYSSSCAYFGGGICTQILGVYVDIQGAIWPCVARQQIINGNPLQKPIGSIRDGDLPSIVWQTHPYLNQIRRSYDGTCPYKDRLP